jgi:hypothetical protein
MVKVILTMPKIHRHEEHLWIQSTIGRCTCACDVQKFNTKVSCNISLSGRADSWSIMCSGHVVCLECSQVDGTQGEAPDTSRDVQQSPVDFA